MAVVVFTWGAPTFDGYRPDFLDRPLKRFHREMSQSLQESLRDGSRMLAELDTVRRFRHLDRYVAVMNDAIAGAGPAQAAHREPDP